MQTKFSAYLSIYNDWDILEHALKSVAAFVDELIVVDGAYHWMVPYLDNIQVNPLRSHERVYDAIRASGIPFRTINRIWSNEIEKRQAGYEACSHRYIYRIDADEIIFFNNKELDIFLTEKAAVAEMQMPLYAAPGWIVRNKTLTKLPTQCFLFDREQIPAHIHLNYLWLVLSVDELPAAGKTPIPVYTKPIAFNAHLTLWRTADTAVNRGVFYVMNYMRKDGVPWFQEMRDRPVTDFRELFEKMPAKTFREAMSRRSSIGAMSLQSDETLEPSPLSVAQESSFLELYTQFLNNLTEQNLQASLRPQALLYGEPLFIDISTSPSRAALTKSGNVQLALSSPIKAAKIKVHTLTNVEPFYRAEDLPYSISGETLSFKLSPASDSTSAVLRQVIELICYGNTFEPTGTFLIEK